VLDQQSEIQSLDENRALFEDEFKTQLEIMNAEHSKHPKARNALPGKPAIVLE